MKDWIKIQRDQEAEKRRIREENPKYWDDVMSGNDITPSHYYSGVEIKEGDEVFYGLLPTDMPCCPKIIAFKLEELDVLYKVVEISPYDTLPKLKKLE